MAPECVVDAVALLTSSSAYAMMDITIHMRVASHQYGIARIIHVSAATPCLRVVLLGMY